MDKLAGDKILESLENCLGTYRNLLSKSKELEDRLRNVEEARESVQDRIYQKVRAEYEQALQSLKKEMAPVEKEIGKARELLSDEIKKISAEKDERQERLDEIAFRHRVGEYDEKRLGALQQPIKTEIEHLSRRQENLARTLVELKNPTKEPTPATAPPAQAQKASAPPKKEQPASQQKPADSPTKSEAEEAVKLLREFDGHTRAEKKEHTFASIAKTLPNNTEDGDDEDPLSMLADPSDDSNDRAAATTATRPAKTDTKTDEKPHGYPNLVITKGPSAGKKIPLLPMTVTIGREHDNNIEIKDEEVARYHARITYQKGDYVLEDMESSTGTWVNEKKITAVKLNKSDKIRMGNTEMVIEFR